MTTPRGKRIDLPRVKAALAKLDNLVAGFPPLTSKESCERLATHLDDVLRQLQEGDDGGKED